MTNSAEKPHCWFCGGIHGHLPRGTYVEEGYPETGCRRCAGCHAILEHPTRPHTTARGAHALIEEKANVILARLVTLAHTHPAFADLLSDYRALLEHLRTLLAQNAELQAKSTAE